MSPSEDSLMAHKRSQKLTGTAGRASVSVSKERPIRWPGLAKPERTRRGHLNLFHEGGGTGFDVVLHGISIAGQWSREDLVKLANCSHLGHTPPRRLRRKTKLSFSLGASPYRRGFVGGKGQVGTPTVLLKSVEPGLPPRTFPTRYWDVSRLGVLLKKHPSLTCGSASCKYGSCITGTQKS